VFSRDVSHKITEEFDILNPTSDSYDIIWTQVNDDPNYPFSIEPRNVIASNGKNIIVVFTYLSIAPTLLSYYRKFEFHHINFLSFSFCWICYVKY
jgi:hypothetical protein